MKEDKRTGKGIILPQRISKSFHLGKAKKESFQDHFYQDHSIFAQMSI